jgi:hypothetical protein
MKKLRNYLHLLIKRIKTSYISSNNSQYLLSFVKALRINDTRKIISQFKVLVNILAVDDKIIELSLSSDFRDFEDGIQYYSY